MRIAAALLVSTLAGSAAFAQNSDLAFLVGLTSAKTSEVVPGSGIGVSGTRSTTFQINYARQFLSTGAGDLYVEFPIFEGSNPSRDLGNNMSVFGRNIICFTPGVRYRIRIQRRLSLYGAVGVGVATFGIGTVLANNEALVPSRTTSAAVDLAGGLDFRLTRLLSLRTEVRDYIASPRRGGIAGRNHVVYQWGVSFHF
jgi:hypothetical protein